jgi:Tol biopolymer transport system component
LYYAKGDEKAEIRVVSSNGGEDHALAGMPTLRGMTDWALGKEGIFFLDRGAGPATIKLFELDTKKIRQIVTLPKPPRIAWGGFCVSPDGQWLAYTQVDDTPADIMLVENFHWRNGGVRDDTRDQSDAVASKEYRVYLMANEGRGAL